MERKRYTAGQLAKGLGFAPSTVTRWCQQGRIKCTKLPSGTWSIPIDEAERILKDGGIETDTEDIEDAA